MKIEEVEIDIGNELQESTGTNNADKVHVWGVCISVFSPELYNMGYVRTKCANYITMTSLLSHLKYHLDAEL